MHHRPVTPVIFALLCLAAWPRQAAAQAAPPPTDVDTLMARVLERRERAWEQLHEFVLSERERFQVLAPGGIPLHGTDREFSWYVRDGFFVRSPVRANGASVGDEERQRYEQRWLAREKRRAERGPDAKGSAADEEDDDDDLTPSDPEALVKRGEPRFVSEAYFLRFRFEPGNYFVAGRETLDGREVIRIEYYPTRLFADDQKDRASKSTDPKQPQAHDEDEDRFNRQFNKVSLVTLWVDPDELQIVKYLFDNVGFGFLPGRWLVRVDGVKASMTMGRYFDGVWLPREIEMSGGLTLASGTFTFKYGRAFSDYKQAETKATIRGYRPGVE